MELIPRQCRRLFKGYEVTKSIQGDRHGEGVSKTIMGKDTPTHQVNLSRSRLVVPVKHRAYICGTIYQWYAVGITISRRRGME